MQKFNYEKVVIFQNLIKIQSNAVITISGNFPGISITELSHQKSSSSNSKAVSVNDTQTKVLIKISRTSSSTDSYFTFFLSDTTVCPKTATQYEII